MRIEASATSRCAILRRMPPLKTMWSAVASGVGIRWYAASQAAYDGHRVAISFESAVQAIENVGLRPADSTRQAECQHSRPRRTDATSSLPGSGHKRFPATRHTVVVAVLSGERLKNPICPQPPPEHNLSGYCLSVRACRGYCNSCSLSPPPCPGPEPPPPCSRHYLTCSKRDSSCLQS